MRIKGTFKKNIFAIILVVTPILLVAAFLNAVFSNIHLSSQLTRVQISEDIMSKTNTRVLQIRVVENTGGNCIRLANVGSSYCGIEQLDGLVRDRLTQIIQEAKADLEFEDFMFKSKEQFPFGGEFAGTREAYSNHIRAWIEFYSRLGACRDYNCYISEWGKPNEIRSTFKIANIAFLDVVPPIDFKGSKAKIEEIFAE